MKGRRDLCIIGKEDTDDNQTISADRFDPTMKRVALLSGGYLMLALGAIGIIVPVLPTTPFVLVAASCFAASSPRTYDILLRSRFFGPYVEHYQSRCGISNQAKLRGIGALWILLFVSAAISGKPIMILVLCIVGIAVTVHIAMIHTKKPSD